MSVSSPAASEIDRLLTVRQVAERLGGISLSAVYQLCDGDSPVLAHVRIGTTGRMIRVRSADLDDYIQSSTRGVSSATRRRNLSAGECPGSVPS